MNQQTEEVLMNGAAAENTSAPEQMDAETIEKLKALRGRLHTSYAQVVMAMSAMPRYRHLPLRDLQSVVMEPLIRDRVAIATPNPEKAKPLAQDTLAGVAIWASVSEEVDGHIREQIKAGVFPVRLGAGDWTSGDIVWLLDVIAASKEASTSVLQTFARYVDAKSLRLHPLVGRMIDKEELKKMGAETLSGQEMAGAGDAPRQ